MRVFVLISMMSSLAFADTYVGSPISDTTLVEGLSTNYGADSILAIKYSIGVAQKRSYMKFTTTIPHGARIESAFIIVNWSQLWPDDIGALRLYTVDEAWNENTTYTNNNGWIHDISPHIPIAPTSTKWNLKGFFQVWADGFENRGIAVRATALHLLEFKLYSSESAFPPIVTVDYTPMLPGDANRDGTFDLLDIIQILQAGKYQTGHFATWPEGDFNGDHVFDQFDIILAQQMNQY